MEEEEQGIHKEPEEVAKGQRKMGGREGWKRKRMWEEKERVHGMKGLGLGLKGGMKNESRKKEEGK